MNVVLWIAASLALANPPAPQAPQAAPAIAIAKAALCTAVSDREPVGTKEAPAEFERAVERIYFWNAADVSGPPRTLKHVWYWDGKAVAEIPLPLKYARTRTWSVKTVAPGAWKVEAVAEDGAVVRTAEFKVR